MSLTESLGPLKVPVEAKRCCCCWTANAERKAELLATFESGSAMLKGSESCDNLRRRLDHSRPFTRGSPKRVLRATQSTLCLASFTCVYLVCFEAPFHVLFDGSCAFSF